MKIPERMYKSGILRGKDLSEPVVVPIVRAGEFTFNEGTEDEQTKINVTVKINGGEKSFVPNMDNLLLIVNAFGVETDEWVGKEIRLMPVASKTLKGDATTIVGVNIPRK